MTPAWPHRLLWAQVLTVAVPVLTTDSLTWSCSGEAPARQCLVTRGLLPILSEGSARATDADTTDDILLVHPCSPPPLPAPPPSPLVVLRCCC